jgi:hypothetical protein
VTDDFNTADTSGVEEPIVVRTRQLIDQLATDAVVARALGGVGIALLCPSASVPPLKRTYGDLDLATPKGHARELEARLQTQGFEADARFNALHGRRRMMFEFPSHEWSIDIFVEEFAMCHTLPLGDRLRDQVYTLTPADLMLTKLQIVQLNSKDAVDVAALLLDVELTNDDSGINVRYISQLLAKDWGWWRTVTGNLTWLEAVAPSLGLDDIALGRLLAALQRLRAEIDAQPKSLRWRARANVGERMLWHEEPEERA